VVKGNGSGRDAPPEEMRYAHAVVTSEQPKLGARLRRIRVAAGRTQAYVASPDYTHAYISTIEAGRRNPSPAALRHFANRLGVDVEDLTTGRPPGIARQLEEQLGAARVAASDGRVDEAEAIVSATIGRAHRHGVRTSEAAAREIRGLLLERTGNVEAALEEYERADDLLGDAEPAVRANAVAGKARCLQAIGDVRFAIFLLESLLRQISPGGADATTLGQIHAELVRAYLDAGLADSARDAARTLERLLPRVRDEARRGQAYLYLATLRAADGDTKESDRLLAAGAAAFESSGLRTETGYAHLMRGIFDSRAGKLAAAEKELRRARAIFEQTRNEKELSNTTIELARVERLRGRADESAPLLDEAIERLGHGNTELLAWAHREYGLLLAERDRTAAEKHLRAALDLFDRGESHIETAATYRLLGDLLRADGQEHAAFEAYSAGIRRLPTSA
jgi:tetratricopeptide (TPR) repeat protein